MEHKTVIIKCDDKFVIQEILKDGLLNLTAGDALLKFVDQESISKLLSFFNTIKLEGSAIGWELNFRIKNVFQAIFIAGYKEENIYTVIGTTSIQETRKYFNDLTKMQNEQIGQIKEMSKDNKKFKNEIEKTNYSFNELTSINNEMASLQRELAKKNKKLSTLNKELEIKNKELDQFAYIVSHDLKAPLRGIVSVIDMITEDYAEEFDDSLKDMFRLITKRVLRMDDLISAILTYARAGKTEANSTTFNLKELIDEILDSLAPGKGYSFILPETLPTFTCNYVQLSQVLTNLLGNAVKYHHKPSGTIELQVKEDKKGFFRLSVKDDGPGIPQKYHDKVFAVFETANQESRTDSTGIGLAIVKKLVENTGGKIGLISEEGQGSTFWFTWPQVVT